MTQETKKQITKGILAFNHLSKKKGKVLYIKGETVGIEIIVSQEGKLRTTTTEEWNMKDISPYKKQNDKAKLHDPNETYYMVRDFHKAFNHPYNDTPTPMDKETALNRAVWTAEELVELLYASVGGDKDEFLKLTDRFLDGIGATINKSITEAKLVDDILVAQADALTDVEYFNQGSFTILGVKPFNLFKIVQAANMGKLHVDENGNKYAKYRESDGKVQKPSNWEELYAPEGKLKEEIDLQKTRK